MRHRSALLLLPALTAIALYAAPGGTLAATTDTAVAADTTIATIVLVRHAEKATSTTGSHDVPLSEQGQQRARELARVLGGSAVWRIYATPTERAMKTGQPLAAAIGDSVRIVAQTAALVSTLQRDAYGHTVLVVGHGNTVPEIIGRLGGPKLPELRADEYDAMFVVTLRRGAAPSVIELRYGAASPRP